MASWDHSSCSASGHGVRRGSEKCGGCTSAHRGAAAKRLGAICQEYTDKQVVAIENSIDRIEFLMGSITKMPLGRNSKTSLSR